MYSLVRLVQQRPVPSTSRSTYILCYTSHLQPVLKSISDLYNLSCKLEQHYSKDCKECEIIILGPVIQVIHPVQMAFHAF